MDHYQNLYLGTVLNIIFINIMLRNEREVASSLRDETTFICSRTFGGWANNESRVQEEYNLLLDSLTDEDRGKVLPNAPFYLAGYDSPMKFFGRKNEIWLMCVDPETP